MKEQWKELPGTGHAKAGAVDDRIAKRGTNRMQVYYLRKIRALMIWILLMLIISAGGAVYFLLWLYRIV